MPLQRRWNEWNRVILVLALLLGEASGAAAPPFSNPASAHAEDRVARAVRVDRPPKLDGTLDDPLWQAAQPITDFRQREPYEGQPPTERTEVRILYAKHEIYFGIFCYDTNASRIVATELRRDVNQDLDDHFEILIDSTHDRRNAYVFQINPLGTQIDGLITEEGPRGDAGDFDPGWDGVWTSAAKLTPGGWSATVAIPFSTLNFMKSTDVVWGVNFKRFIRHKNEEDLWAAYRRTFGITKVSEAGELRGITEIGSGRLLIIKPYALAGFQRVTGSGTSALHTGGLDVKIGLRSNLVANFTGNTDFADSDVDQQQFNLTPFKLFFPEKRQFFLENAGVFDFSTGRGDLLFFSRQIGIDPVTGDVVPINGGAKITGTLAKFALGVMDVETRSNGPNPYANFAVVRVKRSLFGDSYIGAMAIDKRSGSALDPFNRTGGVDTRLVFFKNLILTGYAARTRTPGISRGDSNVGAALTYRTNWMEFDATRRKIGANYNPEVGFLERTDAVQSFLDQTFMLRPKLRGVRQIEFEGFFDYIPDTHGTLQTQEWQGTFRALFHNGSYTDDDIADVFTQRITTPFNIYKNIFVPVGIYHFARHQLTYGSPQDRHVTFNLFERFGTYYGGHLNEASIRATYRPTARFSASLAERWDRFRLPQGNFSVDLASLQFNYSFSRFLSLSTLGQVDTAHTQAVSANIRLRYNYRPDSDLFIIYNVGTRFASLVATNPAQLRESRFAIKFTYSFLR